MYLAEPEVAVRRRPARRRTPAPSPVVSCRADEPIDERAALLYSLEAPHANQRSAHCDHRAVWAFVPQPLIDRPSVFIYFHGMNNFVTASAARPGGRPAGWTRQLPTSLTPRGPYASGPKYGLDAAAQASAHRPLTLAPEVSFGSSDSYWALARAGRLATDPNNLQRLIDDCRRRLISLRRPSGAPYLPASFGSAPPQRLYLSGHSAGGAPVTFAGSSAIARRVPTDLWLLDATYNSGLNSTVVAFARRWRQWSDPAAPAAAPVNRLGNVRGTSRLVIVTLGGLPATNAKLIVDALRQPWRDARGRYPGLSAARFDRGRMTPFPGQPLPPRPELVEVSARTPMSEIESIISRTPVTWIRTPVRHDHIPLDFSPMLLRTAAAP
jgi:hypothetical protein